MSTPIYDQMVEERFTAELAEWTVVQQPTPPEPRRSNVIVTATVAGLFGLALIGGLIAAAVVIL